MGWLSRLGDLIYPSDITCVFCSEDLPELNAYHICPDCAQKIRINNGKRCMKCGKPLQYNVCSNCLYTKHNFKQAKSALVYDDNTRQAVYNLKFQGNKQSAEYLAIYLFDEYQKFDVKFDCVVAVPLSKQRLKNRGYNQSHELLKGLNKYINLEDLTDFVIRTRDTKPQMTLSFEKRLQNVKNVFEVTENKFKNKIVLLIDDVVTTTATINSVSKTLLKAGAKDIYVLSLAHG